VIQLTVYNRTITRFTAYDIRLFISEWDGRCDWLQTTAEHDVVWSNWAGDRGELSVIGACLACPLHWAQGPPKLYEKRGLPLPGCQTKYPSCGLFSADCRCFQVSNPCWEIHSIAFVHHTALTDRITSSCKIFMILFNFYWYSVLDSFPRCTK